MSTELPRYLDVRDALLTEVSLELGVGTELVPVERIAAVEKEARIWVISNMIRARSTNSEIADELGLSLPSVHRLRQDPEVKKRVAELREEVAARVLDYQAEEAVESITALADIRDNDQIGAEHRVKAGLGILNGFHEARKVEAKRETGAGGVSIAVVIQNTDAAIERRGMVALEDIRGGAAVINGETA